MIFKPAKKHPKFLLCTKIVLSIVFSLIILLYFSIVFILPKVIDLNKFIPIFEGQIKKASNLEFKIKDPKLKINYKLGLNILANNININYPNGNNLLYLDKPQVEINLPTLILRKININKVQIKNIKLNLIFENNSYDFFNYFEKNKIINNVSNNADMSFEKANVYIDNIDIILNDKDYKKIFIINTQNTDIKLNSADSISIKTNGSVKNKNKKEKLTVFDININTILPKNDNKVNSTNIKDIINKIKTVNILNNLDNFGFNANILTELKIKNLEKFDTNGFLKIQNLTFNQLSHDLPYSFLNLNFKKNKVDFDTNLYITKNEFIDLTGNLELDDTPKIDISTKCNKVSINGILHHIKNILDILNIKNDFKNIQSTGTIIADFRVKSNFKTLESNGYLEIQNGKIVYPKMNVVLSNIQSYMDFNNNKILIKNSGADLNGAKLEAKGYINTNSTLNIKLISNNLKIAKLIKLLESLKIIKPSDTKNLSFISGNLTGECNIEGKLEEPKIKGNVILNNLQFVIKNIKSLCNINKISLNLIPNKKNIDIKGQIDKITYKPNNSKLQASIKTIDLIGNNQDILIKPFDINSENSTVKVYAEFKNINKIPKINIKGKGTISSNLVSYFIPQNLKKSIASKGRLAIDLDVIGDFKKLNILLDIITDPNNYINIVNIENIKGKTNRINSNIIVSDSNLNINNINVANVAFIKGKITNIYSKPKISLLNINIPQKLSVKLNAPDVINLILKGNLDIFGTMNQPNIVGNLEVTNFTYPKYRIYSQNLNILLQKPYIQINNANIKIGESDFNGNFNINNNFFQNIIINNADFESNFLNSDELTKLMSSIPNTQTTAGPVANIVIRKGHGKIKNLASGNANIQNLNFDFNMKNNIFYIQNLTSNVYGGNITGNLNYNIPQLKANFNLVGKNINTVPMAKAFSGIIIPTSGRLNGIVIGNFRGIDQNTQMRTLTGNAKFTVTNGILRDFAKFEHFLYAGNLISQNILGFNLNNAISSVGRINTGSFKSLNCTLSFKNGWANIKEFKTQGPNMSLYTKGKYNILTNYADLNILGQISGTVIRTLGPFGDFSVNKVIEKIPEKGLAVVNVVKSIAPKNPFTVEVKPQEINSIPNLSTGESINTKKFQAIINGGITSNKSVKSFKWINE